MGHLEGNGMIQTALFPDPPEIGMYGMDKQCFLMCALRNTLHEKDAF